MSTLDALILDLVNVNHRITSDELATIIDHVSHAPFATYISRIPLPLRRQLAQRGIDVPSKLSSIERHLLKRIHIEQQWLPGTTTAQYVADLHNAILHPNVQIWTYRYTGYPSIGFLSPSHVQDVPKPEAYIFVAYSPIFGAITTGYQTSGIENIFTDAYTDVVQHK